MTEPTAGDIPGSDVGITTWSAPNPFGEPTSYVLVHPMEAVDDGTLAQTVGRLGLRRLDTTGDIMPIGTDVLYVSLRAMSVELCTPAGVWLSKPVSDEWTGNAIGRRYVVLVIGTLPLANDADASLVAGYLAGRETVHAALVKIRVRFDRS